MSAAAGVDASAMARSADQLHSGRIRNGDGLLDRPPAGVRSDDPDDRELGIRNEIAVAVAGDGPLIVVLVDRYWWRSLEAAIPI